jgi:hypothetical protein
MDPERELAKRLHVSNYRGIYQARLSDRREGRSIFPDRYLSPDRSSFIDGFLIPVEWRVSGGSITLATMDDCEVIDYHIELETHQAIFAEGAPAETLLITSDRERFINFVE